MKNKIDIEKKKNPLDDIFIPELEVINHFQEISRLQAIPFEQLWSEYCELGRKYERLLRHTMKMTRIGDVNYKKLMAANEKVREQKQELENLNAELRKANITKDKFYSIIAHDLRNPLHFLLFASDMIGSEEGELEEQSMRRYIGKVLKTARNLSELLENLLEWSLSQYGDIQCRPRLLDLHSLVKESIKYLVGNAEKKNINLFMEIPGNTFVFADEQMVKSIIRNLVSNGVKFTRPGGKVSVSLSEGDEEHVTVSVIDTGIGISPAKLKMLFSCPGIDSSEGTAEEKGAHLGLQLVREFVEKNHGSLSVYSEEEKGSKFSFTLPKIPPPHTGEENH